MPTKKSFLIILRLVFILFSLLFIRDAFYKWDGYSYYMRFTEFLPELSLSFILWTIIAVIFAFALWLILYGLFKIIPKHIMAWVIFFIGLKIIKRIFFPNIYLSNLTGFSHITILIIGGVLVAVVIWFMRKNIEKIFKNIEKIFYGFDTRITPLVWVFVFLLILSVPFSVFNPLEKLFLMGFKTVHSQPKWDTPRGDPQSTESTNATLSNERRPNIILVIMDALTALDMQVYGHERPNTPFISNWAKNAVVFDKAYSSSNWTTPATMSIMTGQKSWTHRVWYRAYYHSVSNYENNLPRVLKDNGYAVYGFVQNHYAHPETLGMKEAFLIRDKYYTFWLPSEWWFDKLSNFFVNRPIVKKWIFDENPIAERINIYRPDIYTTLYLSEIVYNRFLEFVSQIQHKSERLSAKTRIEDEPQQPFFAWLHLFPPHDPYLPPKPYMGVFGDTEKFNTFNKQLIYKEYKPKRQPDVDILRKRYDEFILYSDKQFELFLSRLAETIDMSNTIIILTSDHGESFSHGYHGHGGPHLYESLVHIPLIVKIPGEINPIRKFGQSFLSGQKGKVIDMPVEQTDVAPTILELAGIPVPSWMEGRSLVPLLVDTTRFREGKTFEPQPIFSMQLIKNRSFGHPITKGTIAVWEGDYKLIYYLENEKTLLFNLNTDPDESIDLSQKKPKITQRLRKLIEDNLAKANERIKKSS